MNSYETIYTYEALHRAHLAARKGKRFDSEVIEFELSSYAEIQRLSDELKTGTYRVSPYRPFTIHDPKERLIYAPVYRDRVVQHSLCDNVLAPSLDRRLIFDNAASRKDKGTHFAIYRLTDFLRDYYRANGKEGYILKCDMSKYFDNIDHGILYDILVQTGDFDDKTLWLIRQIIGSYSKEHGKGLPLGNQTSQWFALIYLDRMDRIIKEELKIKYYTRYMDDCVLIHEDKEYLKHCLAAIRNHIENDRHLTLNDKTQIVPISQGVDYLGFRFFLTDTGKVVRRVRNSNKKRVKRRFRKFQREYARGLIDGETITRSVRSYGGHLKHGHTYRLRCALFSQLKLSRDNNKA